MLLAILAVQILLLVAVVLLLMRKSAPDVVPDPRQLQLPDQIARLDEYVRDALAQVRRDILDEAGRSRGESATASNSLRDAVISNITTLGTTLKTDLTAFGEASTGSADKLRNDVEQKMRSISQSFTDFKAETVEKHNESQEKLNAKLVELMETNGNHQDKLRATVEGRLDTLNAANTAKLEEMRVTVDEKLQATLNERLTTSFGLVSTNLGEVYKGLGEMKELATGVGDLKKLLTGVKSRGGVGEFLLGQQLEQMFSPEQYVKNARIKPNTTEAVEYALKFPNGQGIGGFALLPIDAKFPKEDWERLEEAYERGSAEDIATAGKAFERAIRTQGKKISENYIEAPTTLPHGIMFLPTEALFAEVLRRPGLQAEILTNHRVTIAGPSNLMHLLTTFQMVFQSFKLEKKGHEIRTILTQAQTQFGKFGDLLGTMGTHLDRAQGTLQDLGVRSRAITRALKNVENVEAPLEESSKLLTFNNVSEVVPLLAAFADGDDK